jgi:hypothetical protein
LSYIVRAGLATAKAERVVAGGESVEVARVRITEAGRPALGERSRFLDTERFTDELREPEHVDIW